MKRLREAPKGWVGIKGSVLPRAKHAWIFGQALAKWTRIYTTLVPEGYRRFTFAHDDVLQPDEILDPQSYLQSRLVVDSPVILLTYENPDDFQKTENETSATATWDATHDFVHERSARFRGVSFN